MAAFGNVDGLDGLVRDISRHADTVDSDVSDVLEKHAKNIADRWRNSVPDPPPTGEHLKASIGHYQRREDGDPVGAAFSDWFVSRLREYGTATQPPRGEANAALEAEMAAFLDSVRKIPRL